MFLRSCAFLVFLTFLSLGNPSLVRCDDFFSIDNLEKFKSNNPDGKKYEFLRTFIESLNYLHLNETRKDRIKSANEDRLKGAEKVAKMMDNILLDNLNLRVARNMLKEYRTPENGLMLKAADLFTKVCNEQIEFNNVERERLVELHNAYQEDRMEEYDEKVFLDFQEGLGVHRKESLKKLLEASYLAGKVLISNREDEYGELMQLGVTSQQRSKLLRKLDIFKGPQFKGEVREGQSFLEASVCALRENLEDYSWAALDE